MKPVSQWTRKQAFTTFLFTAAIAIAISNVKMEEYPISEKGKYLSSVANKWFMDGNLIRGEKYFPEQEFYTILMAADRNKCYGDDFIILLAIRLAENGDKYAFGIKHPKCDRIMDSRPSETLDIQAGWAAATVVKNRQRWISKGKDNDFIKYLGGVYCPIDDKNDTQGLNINWIPNVKYFYNKIKNG